MKTVVISAADGEGNPCSIDDAQRYLFEVLAFDEGDNRSELVDADEDALATEIRLIADQYGEVAWGFQSVEAGTVIAFGPQMPDGEGAGLGDLADMLMFEASDLADDEGLETTDDIAYDGVLRMALVEVDQERFEVKGP